MRSFDAVLYLAAATFGPLVFLHIAEPNRAVIAAQPNEKVVVVESRLRHLRNEAKREWSLFPGNAEAKELDVRFSAERNPAEYSLRLRQQDVKQLWRVQLNGKPLRELVRDEADLILYLPIPTGLLLEGENTLRIATNAKGENQSDDIRVGEIQIIPRPVSESLHEATLEVLVIDENQQRPTPCRITVVDEKGSLHALGVTSNERLAVRQGVVYTADGRAEMGVPAGSYTVFAGRGFEYSVATMGISVAPGESKKVTLKIRREVPTPGYVACDTHIHTLTFSGHGDASMSERLITLAGEGIELPIATDHNVYVDYEEQLREKAPGLRDYFTPIKGVEVTTSVGHFNVFPVASRDRIPDHKSKLWGEIFDGIFSDHAIRIAILNHARDIHSGVRPFGPALFNAAIGENIEGWPMRFNGMEVVNSGATQNDPLRLFHDWMALLNRGYKVTPVGSSDSHDVARYIVGQGRTYIRCNDSDVSKIDTDAAINNFLAGRVLVNYGLLTELTVDDKYHSGDLAPLSNNDAKVQARVLGPAWVEASRLLLYANGALIREEKIPRRANDQAAGILYEHTWTLPKLAHDLHLVAIALGPGVDGAYWGTAKPYQPTSPDWQSYVLGCSGAVWLDADGDGRQTAAREYAEKVLEKSHGDVKTMLKSLAKYDSAISSQTAHVYRLSGGSLEGSNFNAELKNSPPHVVAGFRAYLEAHRENEIARSQR